MARFKKILRVHSLETEDNYVIRRNEEGSYKTLVSYAELVKVEGKSQILYFWKEHKDDESYIPFIIVNK